MKTAPTTEKTGMPLTRGELAKRSSTHFETLRYYEQRGLIRPSFRDSSNYRRYREEDVARLAFIAKAKDLGFTLKEIAAVLELHDLEDAGCRGLGEKAAVKIQEIDQQIATLQRQRALLERVKRCAPLEEAACDCNIMENIDQLGNGCGCG
ncbi:MerR family transcriptional regulator [Pelagicoccus sp. SDUM812003]|uniref:MerR family transcriptional regulator n=1 Tax=Pelagicoccus sp. SDUM812003 TaxID=3041267 RepID=UPI00280F6D58|nr:MerR family transcriptional regulator [Pelagicoccus sp. SDUM812003]MDQ8203545.1 MerR family transcriptional regulator [Pelagicoccus sp. SDUM812003]